MSYIEPIKDEVAAYFCMYYVTHILNYKLSKDISTPDEITNYLDEFIHSINEFPQRLNISEKINAIHTSAIELQKVLPDISKPDICTFIYYYLMLHERDSIASSDLNTTTVSQRQHFIFRYFLFNENITDDKKITIIENIQQRWDQTYNKSNDFIWLNKDDENQCRMVWEYLHNKLPSFIFLYMPSPINNEERYLAIKAYFYAYIQSESDQKFHLKQLKKRVITNRYRKKQEEEKKVLLQTYISVDAKAQLKALAKKQDIPICRLIEKLIKNGLSK